MVWSGNWEFHFKISNGLAILEKNKFKNLSEIYSEYIVTNVVLSVCIAKLKKESVWGNSQNAKFRSVWN